MEFIKKDENTLEVKKTVEVKEEVRTYDYDFLIQQEKDIQAQKDRDNKQRDSELAEAKELIAQCEILGIKSKLTIGSE